MTKSTKTLKRILFALLCAVGCLNASADEWRLEVVNAIDETPIPGVYGRLQMPDSTLVDIATTGDDGIMVLNAPQGKYLLKLAADGFEESVIECAFPASGNGKTKLQPLTNELGEVVIKVDRAYYKADKLIVRPDEKNVRASQSLLDLLNFENLPGLTVNPQLNSISSMGKGVVFKVNGVPRDLNFVQGLPPEKVASIEYVNTPSSRYDDSTGGIINIVLKERLDGGSLYTYFRSSPYKTGFLNTNINGTYNYRRSQFVISYNNDWRDYRENITNSDTEYSSPDGSWTRTEILKGTPSMMRYITNNVSAGYTYYDDKGFVFVSTLKTRFFTDHRTPSGWMSVNDEKPYFQRNETRSRNLDPSLDLFARKEWTRGNSLEANVVASYSSSDYSRSLREWRSGMDKAHVEYPSKVDGSFYGVLGEVFYTHPVGGVNLSGGLKNYFSHSRNLYLGSQKSTMDRDNLYLYANIFSNIGNVGLQWGGGAQYQYVDENSRVRDYWQGRTNLTVSWRLKPSMQISLHADYSPSLPSLSQLTLVETEQNSFITATGNPNLKGQHPLNSYITFWTKIGELNLNAYVQDYHVWNAIIGDLTWIGNGRFVQSYENFRNYDCNAADVNIRYSNIFGHLDVGGSINFSSYYVSNGDYRNRLNQFRWGINGMLHFGGFSFSGYYSVPGKNLYGYNESTGENQSGMSATYKWGQFSVGAGTVFLTKKGCYYPSKDHNPLRHGSSVFWMKGAAWETYVNFTWNLQFGRSFRRSQRNLNNGMSDDSVLRN